MLAVDVKEKWVATPDILCLAELALRWKYYAIFKILLRLNPIGYEPLALYEWKEEAIATNGHKFHRVKATHTSVHIEELIQKIPHLVVLRESVEAVERERPEYLAAKELPENENILFLADTENISTLMPHILYAWQKADKENVCSEILKIQRGDESSYIKDLLACPSDLLQLAPAAVIPDFRADFEKRKALTTVELAQKFFGLCSLKKSGDKHLALIEIEKRFPGLTNREIGQIFSTPSGTEEKDSLEKSGYRLRKEAHKYENIVFDFPVY